MLKRCLLGMIIKPSLSIQSLSILSAQGSYYNCTTSGLVSSTTTKATYRLFSTGKKSKLLKQYKNIKQNYLDFILVFQIGSAYEIYDEDADIVSSKTTLSFVNDSSDLKSMSSVHRIRFPKHQLDEVIRTLCKEKVKVAICHELAKGQVLQHKMMY